jgi:hypothetical protein
LYFSVKQVRPAVQKGTYSEELIDEYIPPSPVANTSNSTGDLHLTPPFAQANSNNNGTFSVGGYQAQSISGQIAYLFSGNITAFINGLQTKNTNSGLSSFIELMWLIPDLTKSVENMAGYMTNTLRNNDSLIMEQNYGNASLIASNQAVQGNVWVEKQIVIVRWPWLVYPAALTVLASIFLVAAILVTTNASLGIWKSSPLALLLHVNPNNEGCLSAEQINTLGLNTNTNTNTADGMQDAAANVRIRVYSTGRDSQAQLFFS